MKVIPIWSWRRSRSIRRLARSFASRAERIRLRAKASVATILASPAGEFEYPEVGNVVYFSQADIAKMKAARDEAIRKKAEERAALEREQTMREFNDISSGDDDIDDTGIDSGDDLFDEGDDGIEDGDDFGDDFGDDGFGEEE